MARTFNKGKHSNRGRTRKRYLMAIFYSDLCFQSGRPTLKIILGGDLECLKREIRIGEVDSKLE